MALLPGWRMDRLITIERKSVVKSTDSGAEQVTWATHASVWASKEDQAGDESLRGAMEVHGATSRVRIRYRSDLTTADRLNLGGGQLRQIVGLAEIGRREGLELACKEWSHE